MKPSFEKIKTDCDQIQPGDWFLPIPLKGESQQFRISEALQRGAMGTYYSVQNPLPADLPLKFQLEPVFDLRQTLFDLARKKRELLKAQIAVIVGSAGKTSVKELVGAMLLQSKKISHFSPTNQNTKTALASQILPLSLNCEKAVFEVGARREKDFEIPLSFLQPEIVCLLNIGTAHVGEFGSLENLRKTKISALKKARIKIIPDELFEEFMGEKHLITFGRRENSDYRLIEDDESLFIFAEGSLRRFPKRGKVPAYGINLTAAVAVARTMGLDWKQIERGADLFRPPEGRFSEQTWEQRTIINDAFNASPESMVLGVEHFLNLWQHEKAVLVLGEMLELGPESEKLHRFVGSRLSPRTPQPYLVTVGTAAEWIGLEGLKKGWPKSAWTHLATATEAQRFLIEKKSTWMIAYLKSSKATGLKNIF